MGKIAERYGITLWELSVAHTAHGIPLRWKNPREDAIPRAERGEWIADHWRAVHGSEPPDDLAAVEAKG
jgi:hypothetical protein